MMNNPVAKTGSKNFPLYRLFHYESNTLSRLIGTGYQFYFQNPGRFCCFVCFCGKSNTPQTTPKANQAAAARLLSGFFS
jgi:hypothetical protein